jgi:hypothetical protein
MVWSNSLIEISRLSRKREKEKRESEQKKPAEKKPRQRQSGAQVSSVNPRD